MPLITAQVATRATWKEVNGPPSPRIGGWRSLIAMVHCCAILQRVPFFSAEAVKVAHARSQVTQLPGAAAAVVQMFASKLSRLRPHEQCHILGASHAQVPGEASDPEVRMIKLLTRWLPNMHPTQAPGQSSARAHSPTTEREQRCACRKATHPSLGELLTHTSPGHVVTKLSALPPQSCAAQLHACCSRKGREASTKQALPWLQRLIRTQAPPGAAGTGTRPQGRCGRRTSARWAGPRACASAPKPAHAKHSLTDRLLIWQTLDCTNSAMPADFTARHGTAGVPFHEAIPPRAAPAASRARASRW